METYAKLVRLNDDFLES